MSRSLNLVVLIGNLGRDAETRKTASGTSVSSLNLATSYRKKVGDGYEDAVDWHSIVLWNSENVAQYLTKGKQVSVRGRLSTRSYDKDGEKKYVTEVIAEEVILLGGFGGDSERSATVTVPKRSGSPISAPISDEDVPF